MLSEWRRVAFVEDFFSIFEEVHCREKGHIGQKKTKTEVCISLVTAYKLHMYTEKIAICTLISGLQDVRVLDEGCM